MIKKNYSGIKKNCEICVLILGGLGFIGSHLSRVLLTKGFRVKIFDKLYGSRELINDIEDKLEIIEGDAEKSDDIKKSLNDVDIVINLIHTTVPASSMRNPAYDVQSNVLSSVRWLSLINTTKIQRIIYISSGGTVYGIPNYNPIDERHPTNPICSYGITKLTIEKYTAMYSNMYDIDYRICRPSNVYGQGQRLNIRQGVIGEFMQQAQKGKAIEIWGDGSIQRDYIYIDDLIDGVVKLINHNGEGRIFNISSGFGVSLNSIIKTIQNELDIELKVKYLNERKFDVQVNILDNTLLKNESDWEPKINLSEGIKKVHDWIYSRENSLK